MAADRERVFVYGTLRRGQRNHDLLRGARALGSCSTRAVFTLIDAGGFPGAVEPGCQAIVGEVYEVGALLLRRLDRLEGHPRLFSRKVIETRLGHCWIYLYRRASGGEAVIETGDWLLHP